MSTVLPVYIGQQALDALGHFCRGRRMERFLLVADRHTYAALGQRATEALRGNSFDVRQVVFDTQEVVADAHHILQVLLAANGQERTLLAVGSGTITDIVRFVAHRTRCPFISLPTAPSVDGFVSPGAPLVVGTYKQTVAAAPPVALFADLVTLRGAPPLMIAAGFADMICKHSSLADWKLGHLLWDEPYDERIAHETRVGVARVTEVTPAIAAGQDEGIRCLMQGLIESGLGMLSFGASHPASGAEHHLSHFWEMKLLREGRPAILHGIKVGVGAVLTAGYWAEIRQISRSQAAELFRRAPQPDPVRDTAAIRKVFGRAADQVLADQAAFLGLSEARRTQLGERVLTSWDGVQAIAATVPPPGEIENLLRSVGGICCGPEIGLSVEEVALAEGYAHFLRNRFTVMKLRQLLDLLRPPDVV